MKSVVLYKTLQHVVGRLNTLAVRLSNGELDTSEAAAAAHAAMCEAQQLIHPKADPDGE